MFACMECGKRFKSAKAARRAANDGCPKCGGVDIDLAPVATQERADHVPVKVEYRMAAPGYSEGFYLVRQDDQMPLWAGYEAQAVMMMLKSYNTARMEAGLPPYRLV
ncbi:MAG TPA: hypothetical protein VNK04_01180 [Gemmataceae bacterium]|nr:hypothetical protein [Gemmataceae bacterium]